MCILRRALEIFLSLPFDHHSPTLRDRDSLVGVWFREFWGFNWWEFRERTKGGWLAWYNGDAVVRWRLAMVVEDCAVGRLMQRKLTLMVIVWGRSTDQVVWARDWWSENIWEKDEDNHNPLIYMKGCKINVCFFLLGAMFSWHVAYQLCFSYWSKKWL